MKIKLAILDNNGNYVERFTSAFNAKYAENFELYHFKDMDLAMSVLDKNKIDVFLANDSYDINFDAIPKRCSFAYFLDSSVGSSYKGKPAISKFQKAELIYKQILSLYSEHVKDVDGLKFGDEKSRIIVFSSPCGGVGTSCMASACASYFAALNKNTLYLNLEKFGSSDIFFSGEGTFDMSDIIYAIKSKKANLALKLKSCVKKDMSGVSFLSKPKVALDMLEMDTEDKIDLITEIKDLGEYDYIIVDIDFEFNEKAQKLLEIANEIIWVCDGSEISNEKIRRAYTALSIMEQNSSLSIVSKIGLIYNKFSSHTGTKVDDIGIKEIGGAPIYTHADSKAISNALRSAKIFDKII